MERRMTMSRELDQARASLKAAKASWCSRNYLLAAYCLARATRCYGEARRLREALQGKGKA